MEALKPLIVLVLFGTILYGAYSVVQKGPSPETHSHPHASDAPAFQAPQVEIPQPGGVVDSQFSGSPGNLVAAGAPTASLTTSETAVAPQPFGSQPVQQPASMSPPPALAAAEPFALPTPVEAPPQSAPVIPPAVPQPAPGLAGAEAALAGAAVGVAVAGATAAALAPAAAPPGFASTGPVNEAPPTYLAAESAPPPVQDDVAVHSGTGDERPQRLATLSTSAISPASLPPEMPPAAAAMPSSAAFATAWADAHDKLTAGRYAEALMSLSVWYDDPSLGLEESHRLEDLLGQLAGSVIYSQQDLLLPPHVVAPGETLPAIAAQLGVSWQLLAKINGIADPLQLVPGEHLKLIRGPFDAVVSISRRRLSLQLGGAYAGSFPVVVGREFLSRVGSSLSVAEVRRDVAGTPMPGQTQGLAAGDSGRAILLGGGLMIEGADEPALVADDAAPASLVVSNRDLDELLDILGPGSSVLLRQ
jgi:hypothetical protein